LPKRWITYLTTLALSLGTALLLGIWFGAVLEWVVAALLLSLAYALWILYLLDSVISGSGRPRLFNTRGVLSELLALVDKLRSKSRMRKRRFHRLLREVRESTDALNDAGVILNSAGEIVWFNTAANRILGLDPVRDIGLPIDNLLRHPTFVEHLTKTGASAITIQSPIDASETLSVQCIPYGHDQRLAIVRDITHETHLERTRRDFVANASHELRSPLTVIAGYLDTLAEDDELPETWQSPISDMVRQTNRMTQILRDLIELTRLETADSEARRDFVDVGEQLKAIAHEFATQKQRPTIELRLESDSALLGSELDLHSIFYNLISNAVRFTPETGSIEVVWRTDDKGGTFEVIDSGIGIAEEFIPRLTERFYRVDTGRSRATGGTGLGLAIVKHALQRHGGKLEIQSREGEGSTFACCFSSARLAVRGGTEEGVI
jgi:two-component system phosphate regulon sensor histidine kinase PhoR